MRYKGERAIEKNKEEIERDVVASGLPRDKEREKNKKEISIQYFRISCKDHIYNNFEYLFF